MFRLALDTENGIIRIGDKITVHIKGEEKPTTCNLTGVFRSVHSPHEVCLNLSDRPHHMSVCEDEIVTLRIEPTEPCEWCGVNDGAWCETYHGRMVAIDNEGYPETLLAENWTYCPNCGRSLKC